MHNKIKCYNYLSLIDKIFNTYIIFNPLKKLKVHKSTRMFSNHVQGETVMNTDTVTASYDGRGQQSNRSVLKKICFLKYNFKIKALEDKRLFEYYKKNLADYLYI